MARFAKLGNISHKIIQGAMLSNQWEKGRNEGIPISIICRIPDVCHLAYAISSLSQYMANPSMIHWKALFRVIRYVRATIDLFICYGDVDPSNIHTLHGYTDANWAGEIDTRRSTFGLVFLFNNGPISWNSQKTTSIAMSSIKSKYIAVSQATKEAIWSRNLLSDIGLRQSAPTIIQCDN